MFTLLWYQYKEGAFRNRYGYRYGRAPLRD